MSISIKATVTYVLFQRSQNLSGSLPRSFPTTIVVALVAANAMALVLGFLYFWYEVWAVRSTQETVGYTLWRLFMSVAGEMGVLILDSFVSFEVNFPFFFVKETQKYR